MTPITHSSSSNNTNASSSSPRSEGTDNDNLVSSPIVNDVQTTTPVVNTSEENNIQASVTFQHHLPTRSSSTIHSALSSSGTSASSPPDRPKRHSKQLSAPHIYDKKELDYTMKPSAKLPQPISSRNPALGSKLPSTSPTSPTNSLNASQSRPDLYKSIHALDAKLISHNMEKSNQQRQVGGTKHPIHTEDLPSETLTHAKPHQHSMSINAPLPPTPVSRSFHPFHRHTSISGRLHLTTSTSSNDSLWQDICVRVLPLFNGQGVQGAVEDMNDLLRQCLSDPISPRFYHHIESLLHDGMFTLNTKLFGVTDEKLLDRLVEQWSFFFTYALPYFEAVFLPLRTDIQYQSKAERWNIRNMALESFRDNVILPQTKRLEDVFRRLFTDTGSSQNPVATAAKMLQMVSLLASVPDPNEEIDRVLAKLKTQWKTMMRKGGWDWQAGMGHIRYGLDDVLV